MKKNICKCPYCDSEVKYIEALTEISTGEHTCSVCNKNSNIKYNKKMYIPAAVLLALAIIIASVVFFASEKSHMLLALVIVLIPFAAFYFITPLYFELTPIMSEAQKPVVKRKVKSKKQSQITPRAVKIEEVKRVEKEQKKMDKSTGSLGSKFQKFIKTYIIVDDEEESSEKVQIKESNTETDKPAKNKPANNKPVEIVDVEEENEAGQMNDNGIEDVDPLADEEEMPVIGVYTNRKAYESRKKEPVYHKLNRKTDIDFVYLPESCDVISINPDELEYADIEEKENDDMMAFFNKNTDVYIEYVPDEEDFAEDTMPGKTAVEEKTVGDEEAAKPVSDAAIYADEAEESKELFSSSEFEKVKVEKTENNNDPEKDIMLDEDTRSDKSFDEELDLSEYKTSSYIDDGSIDIEIEEEEEQDEEIDIGEEYVDSDEVEFEKELDSYLEEAEQELIEKAAEVGTLSAKSVNPAKKAVSNIAESIFPKNTEKNSDEKEQSEMISFFRKMKVRVIEATAEEREEAFKQEEREKKLAEKEARRKAKEKEKERLEKEKAKKAREDAKALSKTASDDENEDISQEKPKEKTAGKDLAKTESNIENAPADSKTIVFKKPVASDYEESEKAVLSSIKNNKSVQNPERISEQEKVKIIADKHNEEQRQARIEKKKAQMAKEREQQERSQRNKKLQYERQQKAEQLRQQQAVKAKESQRKIKNYNQKRDVSNINLTDVDKVKTTVSQKKEQKRQQTDKFFKNTD